MRSRVQMAFGVWRKWLIVVTVAVILYSVALMALPEPLTGLFRALFFVAPPRAASFGAEATAYVRLVQGVLGAVMIGWMVTICAILVGGFRRQEREAWNTVALSIAVWFVVGTGFSLAIGNPAHALFNVGFLVAFSLPLANTHGLTR
jgi:hypothetical protein